MVVVWIGYRNGYTRRVHPCGVRQTVSLYANAVDYCRSFSFHLINLGFWRLLQMVTFTLSHCRRFYHFGIWSPGVDPPSHKISIRKETFIFLPRNKRSLSFHNSLTKQKIIPISFHNLYFAYLGFSILIYL